MRDNNRITRGGGRRWITAALGLLVVAMALKWSWNHLGVGLLGLPEAKYVHGVALAAVVGTVALIWRAVAGGAARTPKRHSGGAG